MARRQAFAIIKLSTNLPGWENNPEWVVEVVKIVFDAAEAQKEAARLNACASNTKAKFIVKNTKVIGNEV